MRKMAHIQLGNWYSQSDIIELNPLNIKNCASNDNRLHMNRYIKDEYIRTRE